MLQDNNKTNVQTRGSNMSDIQSAKKQIDQILELGIHANHGGFTDAQRKLLNIEFAFKRTELISMLETINKPLTQFTISKLSISTLEENALAIQTFNQLSLHLSNESTPPQNS